MSVRPGLVKHQTTIFPIPFLKFMHSYSLSLTTNQMEEKFIHVRKDLQTYLVDPQFRKRVTTRSRWSMITGEKREVHDYMSIQFTKVISDHWGGAALTKWQYQHQVHNLWSLGEGVFRVAIPSRWSLITGGSGGGVWVLGHTKVMSDHWGRGCSDKEAIRSRSSLIIGGDREGVPCCKTKLVVSDHWGREGRGIPGNEVIWSRWPVITERGGGVSWLKGTTKHVVSDHWRRG